MLDKLSINLAGNLSFTFHIDFKNTGGAVGCKGKSTVGGSSISISLWSSAFLRVLCVALFRS